MKKFLILAAATLALCACAGKQYTYEDLVFDYPSLYKVKMPTNDFNTYPDQHLFFLEDVSGSSMDLLAIEIITEEPGSLQEADPDVLSEYLAEKAFEDLKDWALDDEDFTLTDKTASQEEVQVATNSQTGLLEAHAYAKGKWDEDDIFAEAYSTTFDGRYTISMIAISHKESYLNLLVDVYRSVHLKQ